MWARPTPCRPAASREEQQGAVHELGQQVGVQAPGVHLGRGQDQDVGADGVHRLAQGHTALALGVRHGFFGKVQALQRLAGQLAAWVGGRESSGEGDQGCDEWTTRIWGATHRQECVDHGRQVASKVVHDEVTCGSQDAPRTRQIEHLWRRALPNKPATPKSCLTLSVPSLTSSPCRPCHPAARRPCHPKTSP